LDSGARRESIDYYQFAESFMKNQIALTVILASFLTVPAMANTPKTHSWFHKTGVWNCPAITYYTSMSTSSSTSSDSCQNVTWIVENKKQEQKRFADANYALLEQEVSQGQGVHIEDYAKLMGCGNSSTALGHALRQNFDQVFSPDSSTQTLLEQTEILIHTNSELSTACRSGA
jgi:hypothetical protein